MNIATAITFAAIGFSAAIFVVPVYAEIASERLRALHLPLGHNVGSAPQVGSPLSPWSAR